MSNLRIYLATSWKNPEQQRIVADLRARGHEVFDFRNPPNNAPLKTWKHILSNPSDASPEEQRAALSHNDAVEAFVGDMRAIRWSSVLLAIGPYGKDTCIEIGYAAALGKMVGALLVRGDASLMISVADALFVNEEEMHNWLERLRL